jgi:hypothetical protein
MLAMFEAFNQNKMPTATEIRTGTETPKSVSKKLKNREDACVNCRCKKQANMKK